LLRSVDVLSLTDSAILDDRGRTGAENVLAEMRLVLRRDGRLAGGRGRDCALRAETAATGVSLSFPATGCEGSPTGASRVVGRCLRSGILGHGLELDGRTSRCGSQRIFPSDRFGTCGGGIESDIYLTDR